MSVVAVVLALALIGFVLWEGFETMVLPRRVDRRLRLTSFSYRCTWPARAAWSRRLPGRGRREYHLSVYGPLSLILLMGIGAAALVFGFALLHLGISSDFAAPEGTPSFGAIAYHSGVTLFTVGFGDIAPRDPLGRAVAVLEAGTGLAFLAVISGHLPILYQALSRREVSISLLDARAGSPPSGVELLRRSAEDGDPAEALHDLLHDRERWSAELLENPLSYPLPGYFRSHHDRRS
jgi:ion channel